MTRSNQFNVSKQTSAPQLDEPLDRLSKGKEAIHNERIRLLEDKFIQSVSNEKQALSGFKSKNDK